MASYFIGEPKLDRFVLRALKKFAGNSVSDVHKQTCLKLMKEGVVAEFQLLPDENDIWCALQRLVSKGWARKYTVGSGVRYQASPMK